MKIAFLGTHGTGKTTLAHDLVTKLKKQGIDAGFLGEVARECPFSLNEDTTKKSQIWIILSQIIAEMESEERSETLICDRSVLMGLFLDVWARYILSLSVNQGIIANVFGSVLRIISESSIVAKPTIDEPSNLCNPSFI